MRKLNCIICDNCRIVLLSYTTINSSVSVTSKDGTTMHFCKTCFPKTEYVKEKVKKK